MNMSDTDVHFYMLCVNGYTLSVAYIILVFSFLFCLFIYPKIQNK